MNRAKDKHCRYDVKRRDHGDSQLIQWMIEQLLTNREVQYW